MEEKEKKKAFFSSSNQMNKNEIESGEKKRKFARIEDCGFRTKQKILKNTYLKVKINYVKLKEFSQENVQR